MIYKRDCSTSASGGNQVDGSPPAPSTGAVAFVVILAVPTFYYLAVFKALFENFICIKISLDTISLKQIHEEKHPLTFSGSTIGYINH